MRLIERVDRWAARAHEDERTAGLWHALHAAVAVLSGLLALGEAWYHVWGVRMHRRAARGPQGRDRDR